VVGCVLTSYTVTGCVNLSQTPLDPSRIDSSCIITQVPACGYESTVSVSVVPNSVLTASVSSTNRVNLAIQEISDNTLAGTYNFVVTATIPSYPYVTKPTATAPVTIVVVDPCTTSTIAAQTIPKIATFVGFTKSVGPFNFVDTVTTNCRNHRALRDQQWSHHFRSSNKHQSWEQKECQSSSRSHKLPFDIPRQPIRSSSIHCHARYTKGPKLHRW
jgi:hypothetical protein